MPRSTLMLPVCSHLNVCSFILRRFAKGYGTQEFSYSSPKMYVFDSYPHTSEVELWFPL